ncbi:MAG: spore coat protein U domain-containing protein [Bacteroidia bacterium]|nr:spore coat protein U domain-containing protein [Methylotenera sp.]
MPLMIAYMYLKLFFLRMLTSMFLILLISQTAHANPSCLTTATGPIAIYDPLGAANIYGVGNVKVTCIYVGLGSPAVAYQIQLSTGVSNSFNNRTMRFLANQLVYNLYINPSYSLVWGDNTSGTATVNDGYSISAGTIIKNYPVYMRIPSSQLVNAGSYADTITVTVVY